MEKRSKILWVENEPIDTVLDNSFLRNTGYSVLRVQTGEEAFEVIQSNLDIKLVLLNADLSEYKKSIKIAESILLIREIPIVFLIEKANKEIIEEINKKSSYGFAFKDSEVEILASTIQMTLDLFQTKQKLLELENRWDSVLQNTQQGVLDWNIEENSVLYSTNCKTILGYINGEIPTQLDEWKSRIHPDDKPIVLTSLEKCVKGEAITFKMMYRLLTNSKELSWVLHEARISEINNPHKAKHFIGTLKHITSDYRNQEMLRKAAKHIPGMMYQFRLRDDGSSYCPYVSNGIKDIYNLNPEDVLYDATPIFDKIHPEDFPNAFNSISESLNSLTAWKIKFRVLSNQKYIWVSCESRPEKLNDGTALWHGYIQEIIKIDEKYSNDLSEDQLARLHDSHSENLWNQNLRRYYDDAPISIFKANDKGEFNYVNQAAATLLGYSKSELLHLGIKDISEKPDVNISLFNEMKDAKKLQGIARLKKKDGSKTITNYNAFQIAEDSYLSFNICIDDQIQSLKIVEKQRLFYEKILDLIPINVYTVDSKGAFQFANKTLLDEIGVCLHDIIGKTAYNYYPAEDAQKYWRDDQKVVRSKKRLKIIEQYVQPITKIKQVVQTIKSPILDDENKVQGIVGIVYDITSQSQISKAKDDKLIEQAEILKQVHNRITNDLGIIIEIINLQADLSDNLELKNGINEAASRLAAFSFINDKLYNNKIQGLVEINEYLLELQLELIQNTVPGTISLEFDIAKVQLDEKKALLIGIIIIELITNSIKYAFANKLEGIIEVHLAYINGRIELIYSDDGIGFFDYNFEEKRNDFSLKMIESLLAKIEGTFKIESQNKIIIYCKS